MCPRYFYVAPASRQRGFLIPLSLFIVVVMGVLALVVSRTGSHSQRGFTQELLGVQAFYAAESGAQRGMQALFFPDASNRSAVDGRCVGLNQTYSFAGVDGLNLCEAQVTCSCAYNSGAACAPANAANYGSGSSLASSFYTLTSIGRCGSNDFQAERSIQASAYLEQE